MKILISLILFLPYFAFSFIEGVPYAKTQICEQTKSDFSKAAVNLSKTIAGFSSGDLPYSLALKGYGDFSKAYANLSKALSDGLKHKCFKETPACVQSVKDLSKADAESSKIFADLLKTLSKFKSFSKEALVALDKADAASDKALDASSKAADDMIKYCSDKAPESQGEESKIKKLLKKLKELLSF